MTDVTKITSGSLIAADKVNGTTVYNTAGEKLGSVDDVMLDKKSGRVIYAVLSFGGILGLGEKQYPLPWSSLTYDESKEGFVISCDKSKLEQAPSLNDYENFNWTADYGRTVDRYYGAPTYW
jgi:sporulation protein YlmC with PRC-barrel domain